MHREYPRTITCLLLSFYLTSCAGENKKNAAAGLPGKDSSAQITALQSSDAIATEENTADSILVVRDKQIAGSWNALDGEDELTINITKDSIHYVEHSESHRYELKRDSIFIHYPDYVLSAKPLLLKDTFAIIADDHVSKFSRVKN